MFPESRFLKNDSQDVEYWDEDDVLPLSELKGLWDSYKTLTNMNDVAFEDYVHVDDAVCTMKYPTEEDILESVIDSRISSGAGMYFSS